MIPWCFAYNDTNYARCLPWYLHDMHRFSSSHPDIEEYLHNGGFSTQLTGENAFGRVPMDQTIEEIVNKDSQTAGGTKGFSVRKSAVARYYITVDYRAYCVRQLRHMTDIQHQGLQHPDLRQTRIKQDEEDIKSLFEMLKSIWRNPFALETQELCSISTGAMPQQDVTMDLCKAQQVGKEAYQ